jgi:biotin operon repressor
VSEDTRHVIIEDEALAAGFTQIPNLVLRRADLQPGAKLTYMVLLSYAWQQDHAYPGQDRLAADMGVSERSVITYLKQLQETGLVTIRRRGLGLTNVYVLHRLTPRSEKSALPEVQDSTGLEVQDLPPKNTQTNNTQGEHFESSKGPVSFEQYDQARLAILPYAEDLARELGDQAPLTSTTTRLTNLYRHSGLALDTFLDLLIAARGITQERTGSIRTQRPDGPGPKPKMAYWFTVLEDLISQAQAATGTGND